MELQENRQIRDLRAYGQSVHGSVTEPVYIPGERMGPMMVQNTIRHFRSMLVAVKPTQ